MTKFRDWRNVVGMVGLLTLLIGFPVVMAGVSLADSEPTHEESGVQVPAMQNLPRGRSHSLVVEL